MTEKTNFFNPDGYRRSKYICNAVNCFQRIKIIANEIFHTKPVSTMKTVKVETTIVKSVFKGRTINYVLIIIISFKNTPRKYIEMD